MTPYISWSQLNLYETDPNKYYVRYVVGVKEPSNLPMILGSAIHDAISGKIDNVETPLLANHFTADVIRVAKELVLKAPRYERQEVWVNAYPKEDNGLRCPLMGIYDGLNNNHTIGEYKTTKNGWKDLHEINDFGQLTFYALIYKLNHNIFPLLFLHRLDTGNGKLKTIQTSRTQEQLEVMLARINVMHKELIERGWWDRRK